LASFGKFGGKPQRHEGHKGPEWVRLEKSTNLPACGLDLDSPCNDGTNHSFNHLCNWLRFATLNFELETLNWRAKRMGSFGKIPLDVLPAKERVPGRLREKMDKNRHRAGMLASFGNSFLRREEDAFEH
jgi:hypothetical protein